MRKSLFIFIASLFLIPGGVLASEVNNVDYDLNQYNIESYIRENGNVDTCEYIKQDGSFNGFYRDLVYSSGNKYSADGISDIKVYDYDFNSNKKLSEYTLVNNAFKGENLKYTSENIDGGNRVTLYNATSNDVAGYAICYTLNNAVIVHNDVAEFYWTYLNKDFADRINNLSIKIYLSKIDNTLKVWAHGPVTGNVYPKEDNGISYLDASIDALAYHTALDTRMTFDKSLVQNSTRLDSNNALDGIIEEETKLANEANAIREKAKKTIKIARIGSLAWAVVFIIVLIYVYFKYDKEESVPVTSEYYRDIPNDYPVEVVEYLTNKGVSDKSFSATIIELIRRKYLIISNNDKDNFEFKVNDSYKGGLSESEQIVIDLIVKEIGDGEKISIKEINKYCKSQIHAPTFIKYYDEWKALAKANAEGYNFYVKSFGHRIIPILIGVIGIGICILHFNLGIYGTGFLTGLFAVIGIIYLMSFSKKTKGGMITYSNWMGFKKFLKDFGRFNEKELPEISLWEKYLVYAHVLGCAKELQKEMKIKIEQMNNSGNYNYNLTDYYVLNSCMRMDLFNTIARSVSGAVHTSTSTVASTNSSSGSGFGGGFSSGGGFGGGGGGGGGF